MNRAKSVWLLPLLALVLLLLLPRVSMAQMNDSEPFPYTAKNATANNDELFAAYVEQQLYASKATARSSNYGETLFKNDSISLHTYRQLKSKIEYVAANGGSTTFKITLPSGLTYSGTNLTVLVRSVIECVRIDCPYEIYWWNYSWSYSHSGSTLNLTMSVHSGYRGSGYSSSNPCVTTNVSNVKKAVAEAKRVVSLHASKSDMNKLKAYRDYICNAVDYNYAAASSGYNGTRDPWQLIWVFDSNPSTKVVCEGYAKAFKYLCDLSTFSASDFACYSTIGYGNGGLHQWNVVTLGGYNYMTDLTWYDSGWPVFMRNDPDSGDGNGYTFWYAGSKAVYQYADETKRVFGENIRKLGLRFSITKQPVSAKAEFGSTASFSVTAKGSNLLCQWQYRSPSSTTWQNFSSASSKTSKLSFSPQASHNGLQIRCLVKDGFSNTLISNTVSLTVTKIPLKITKNPVTTYVKYGNTASLSLTAQGNSLSYQWQYYSTSAASWQNFAAASGKTNNLKFTPSVSHHGLKIRCKVSDAYNQTIDSPTVQLFLSNIPLKITKNPADVTTTANKTATFTIETQGNVLSYQWQYLATSTSVWKDFSSTSSKTKTLTLATKDSYHGYRIRCRVSDTYGDTVYSSEATLFVNGTALVITQNPSNAAVELGQSTSFVVVAQGVDLQYEWQYCFSSDANWQSFTSSSAKTSKLTFKPSISHDGLCIRCKVTNKFGNVIYSSVAFLTVKIPLKIVTQPSDTCVAPGEVATFVVEAQGNGLAYEWQYRLPGGNWTAFSSYHANSRFAVTSNTTCYIRCRITDTYENELFSRSATMTVSENIANAASSPIQPKGSVSFLNGKLYGGEFRFALYEKGSDTPLQTVTNSPDGSFCFAPISIDPEKPCNYVVRELPGNRSGVEYDQSEYQITLLMSKGANGSPTASRLMYIRNGVETDELLFTNTFRSADSVPATGDREPIALWMISASSSLLLGAAVLFSRRRKQS